MAARSPATNSGSRAHSCSLPAMPLWLLIQFKLYLCVSVNIALQAAQPGPSLRQHLLLHGLVAALQQRVKAEPPQLDAASVPSFAQCVHLFHRNPAWTHCQLCCLISLQAVKLWPACIHGHVHFCRQGVYIIVPEV